MICQNDSTKTSLQIDAGFEITRTEKKKKKEKEILLSGCLFSFYKVIFFNIIVYMGHNH